MKTGKTSFDVTATLGELEGLKRGTRVRLVCPEAWRGRIDVNAQRVQSLSPAQLAELLAYEAEAYSGVAAAAGVVAWQQESAHGSLVSFQVMQVSLAEIDELRRQLRARKLTLAALTHPDFLALGAAAPTAAVPPEPLSPRQLADAGLRRMLVVVVLMAAVTGVLKYLNAEAERDCRAVEAERAGCQAIVGSTRAMRSEIDGFAARREREIDAPLRRLRARRSYARILAALAETCPAGGMISEMKSDGDYTLALAGLATTSDEAETFLQQLAQRLEGGGFALTTLALESMNQLPGGGPWRFRCRIEPKAGEVAQ